MAALTLVQRNVSASADYADDFAVLSLQDWQFIRWSQDPVGYSALADDMMRQFEQLCSLARNEFGWPSPEAPEKDQRPQA